MEIEYLRTSRKSYMIVKDADYAFENYELQMILHNEIPNLLEFQVIVGDGSIEYWYDVTGMQALEKLYLVTSVDESQLRFLLKNLVSMKNAMEEYLLDDHNLSYSLSMVFYDRFTERIRFCYIPGLEGQQASGMRDLFGDLLQYLNHSDTAAVRLGYEMYERSMQSEFLVEDCVECLTNHDFKNEVRRLTESHQALETANDLEQEYNWFRRNAAPDEEADVGEDEADMELLRQEVSFREKRRRRSWEEPKGFWKKKKRERKRSAISYSEILDEEQRNFYAAEEIQGKNETECFSTENTETRWELIYKGDGEEQDIVLKEFPFLLGTNWEKVQGVLKTRTVSRVHARLYLEDGKLYLEDYNSTNGTYVNHRLIPMNTPVQIKSGDRVVFATEEFVVSCRQTPKA